MNFLQGFAYFFSIAGGMITFSILMIFIWMPFALKFGGVKLRRGAIAMNSAFLMFSLGVLALSLPFSAELDVFTDMQMPMAGGSAFLLISGGILLRKAIRA